MDVKKENHISVLYKPTKEQHTIMDTKIERAGTNNIALKALEH